MDNVKSFFRPGSPSLIYVMFIQHHVNKKPRLLPEDALSLRLHFQDLGTDLLDPDHGDS